MSPRIGPAEPPPVEAAETLAASPQLNGRPLNIFGTLAHHPLLFRRYNAFGGALLFSQVLPARERELVILRVASRTGCGYEFHHHTRLGGEAGLSPDEIERSSQPGVGSWAPADGLLVQMADELIDTNNVSDPTWAALAERWSEAQLIELVLLVGFYRMTAGFLNSVGVEAEDATKR
jgi:4-carboxymuconolactone decarboxylase